ncbi:MAG TPA: phosphatase PAP2 family protein [Aquihabitans sp.]|jgi:hypothetical protein|nr:phosphatase PAP2 family protein [Aquihabitans sp.]
MGFVVEMLSSALALSHQAPGDRSWILGPSGLVSSIGGAPVRLAVLSVLLVALIASRRPKAALFTLSVAALVHVASRSIKAVSSTPRLPSPHRAYGLEPTARSAIILCVLVAGAAVLTRRWRQAAVLVPAGYLALLAVDRLVRAIPVSDAQDSLPSGHAANTMAIALAFVAVRRVDGERSAVVIGAPIAAALVGISRVTLGYHRVGEVLAGWLLAGAATLVLHAVIRPDPPMPLEFDERTSLGST